MLPNIRGGAVKKPAPLQRPGIILSEDIHGSKKRWVKADPRDIVPGDIIRGQGLVVDRTGHSVVGFQGSAWVDFEMKNGTHFLALVLPEVELVVAFTEAEGEPVG